MATDERLYLTNGDEYQVLSLNAAGDQRWALRVAQPRRPFSDEEDEEVDHFLDQIRRSEPDAMRPELNVADLADGLDVLHVDGHVEQTIVRYRLVEPFDSGTNR